MKRYVSLNNLSRFWYNLKSKLSQKVDKIDGKGLSTNDFTNAYKDEVNSISTIKTDINNIKTTLSGYEWAVSEKELVLTNEEWNTLNSSNDVTRDVHSEDIDALFAKTLRLHKQGSDFEQYYLNIAGDVRTVYPSQSDVDEVYWSSPVLHKDNRLFVLTVRTEHPLDYNQGSIQITKTYLT